MKLCLDFESYYNTSEKYTLNTKQGGISVVEYVRDPRYKSHGLGFSIQQSNGKWTKPQWVTGERVATWAQSIDWSDVTVIAHNTKFDGFILKQKYDVQPASWICTKAMARAVLGKTIKNNSLATIAEHYGFVPKGVMRTDGIRDLTPEQESELAEYCLHDVELGTAIFDKLEPEFPASQYAALSWTIQAFVDPKLVLDVNLLKETAKGEIARKINIFEQIKIDKKVFSSNPQFKKLLESKGYECPMKLSPKAKDKDGKPKIIPALALGDEDFLDMLESENEELKTLCEARVAAKSNLLQTRSERLANLGATGLWPFDVEYSGASQTHRAAGGASAGGNPQNFTACRDAEAHKAGHECPGRLRTAVKPLPGYKLIVGDFATIELRLVAYLSKDRGLIEAIEKGIDLYCEFASAFFNCEVTKKDEAKRRFGKTAILGLGYGMGAKKFRKKVRTDTGQEISMEDAKRAVDLYRSKYIGVTRFWDDLDRAISLITRENGGQLLQTPIRYTKDALVLPSGLKMRYPNLRQFEGEWVYDVWDKGHIEQRKLYGGKVLENICQGLAGELCKEAAAVFNHSVTGMVHDEIHVVCKKGVERLAAKRLERAMTIAPTWLPQIRLKAEVGVGDNWFGAK